MAEREDAAVGNKQGAREVNLSINQIIQMAEGEKRNFSELENRAMGLQGALLETIGAIESLDEAKRVKEKPIFVSLGSGVYAKAKLEGTDSFLLAMQSGIMLGKNFSETKEILSNRKKSLEEELERVRKALESSAHNLNNLDSLLGQIAKARSNPQA